jgi:hypothetical protein
MDKKPTRIGETDPRPPINEKINDEILFKSISGNIWLIAKPFILTKELAPRKLAPTPKSAAKINKNIPTIAPDPHIWK